MEDLPSAAIPNIPHWSENYAISGLDPVNDLHLHMHIGRWRKDLTLWREVFVISLPDGTGIGHRAIGNARATPRGPGGPNMSVEFLGDGKIRYSFLGAAARQPLIVIRDELTRDGPMERLEFDLLFTTDLPIWDLAHVGESTEYTGREHIEQVGLFEGMIKVGRDEFTFSALANRDHSRGPRVMDSIFRHHWFQVMLDNGITILAYEAESSDATQAAFAEAAVYEDGKLYPAKVKIHHHIEREGAYQHIDDPVPFTVEYENGALNIVAEKMLLTTSTFYTAPWDLYAGRRRDGGVDYCNVAHQGIIYTIDGKRAGHGHMERTIPGPLFSDPV